LLSFITLCYHSWLFAYRVLYTCRYP